MADKFMSNYERILFFCLFFLPFVLSLRGHDQLVKKKKSLDSKNFIIIDHPLQRNGNLKKYLSAIPNVINYYNIV